MERICSFVKFYINFCVNVVIAEWLNDSLFFFYFSYFFIVESLLIYGIYYYEVKVYFWNYYSNVYNNFLIDF